MKIFNKTVQKLIINSTYFSFDEPSQKLFLYVEGTGEKLTLSQAVPILQNLGLQIAQCRVEEKSVDSWQLILEIHDSLQSIQKSNISKAEVEEFLKQVFSGQMENDVLNKFIISSRISVRYLLVLRALTKYLQQIKISYNLDTLYKCLVKNEVVTELFVEYFEKKFDPELNSQDKQAYIVIAEKIEAIINDINNRDEDLICRRYFSVLQAVTRTNFYKHLNSKNIEFALSLKIEPKHIDNIPKPVPAYEVFIYNQFVEGVHLRGGKVARGGIRFSDRAEDYRTEVLGLVKAQMVKNSVIVPVGAKGGFICKVDFMAALKQEYFEYIKAGYETFIRALLDLTDNRVDGETVRPDQVIPYDDEDPYFVVAADKGTATFSDFANEIAAEYHYWLGDAFASGGQNGYDHKKMGITAKGAWQSAKRLFIERGVNIDRDKISVVGIGDMSGDVFGNGMLLSSNMQLIAAFNHMHIFIDPNPNPQQSFAERKRLFELPHSTWADYDQAVLSKGGAVYERSLKQITLNSEAAKRLGLKNNSALTPDQLIRAILSAEVDMLWNGGIGTYVKASSESNGEVSDKANDNVRVNANEVGAAIIGEGGNLGLTQKARIEYDLNGGLVHMDAVDNSAGVDCSDHEVNIKILLDDIIQDGLLSIDERNALLANMSDAVSDSVLTNNYRQSKMLSQSNYTAPHFTDSFIQLINLLESYGALDREMACIPSQEKIETRVAAQQNFTRPELATLLAYSKTRLFNKLVGSNLIEDEFFQNLLLNYFPEQLSGKYPEYIKNHPLRKQILASYLTNDIANRMGATFCNYTLEDDVDNIAQLVKAHMAAVEILNVNGLYSAIDDMTYFVESDTLLDLQLTMHYPLDKAMTWLMQHNAGADIQEQVSVYQPVLHVLKNHLAEYLSEQDLTEYKNSVSIRTNEGVDKHLAESIYALKYYYYIFPIVQIIQEFSLDPKDATEQFFRIGKELNIFWLYRLIESISIDDFWKRKSKDLLLKTIERHHLKALRVYFSSQNKVAKLNQLFPKMQHYLDLIGLAKAKPAYHLSMVNILASKLGHLVE